MTYQTTESNQQKAFENIVKHSDVVNQVILDADTMEELGRIEVLWMFPQVNRVLGFVAKSGFLGGKKAAFKLPQLVSIGHNGVLVRGEGEPTVGEKVQKLESLINCEVWNDEGERIGYIIDCLFNFRSGVIVRYLMVPGRFARIAEDVYLLPPKAILRFGHQRVLVNGEDVQNLKPYQHGLKSKLALVREKLQTEYIDSVTGGVRSLAQQALQRMEQWSDRLRTETQHLVEQARERSQGFVDQAKTSSQSWVDTLKTESQSFSNFVQDVVTQPETNRDHETDFPRTVDRSSSHAVDAHDWDEAWADADEEDFDESRHRAGPRADGANGAAPEDDDWDEDEFQDRSDERDRPQDGFQAEVQDDRMDEDEDWDEDWEDWEEEAPVAEGDRPSPPPPTVYPEVIPPERDWDELSPEASPSNTLRPLEPTTVNVQHEAFPLDDAWSDDPWETDAQESEAPPLRPSETGDRPPNRTPQTDPEDDDPWI